MEGQTSSDILCKEINAQSKAEAETILEQAEKEAAKIIKEAEKQADKTIAEWVQKAESSAEGIQRRILSGVHLEVKKQALRSREVIIQSIMQNLLKKLDAFREEPPYLDVLKQWIQEGAMAVDGEAYELECGEIEHNLITKSVLDELAGELKKLKQSDVTLRLSNIIHKEGGVVVVHADGRTRFDNRFSARIKRDENALRLKIMNTVFENE